jgi:hypothetical protein
VIVLSNEYDDEDIIKLRQKLYDYEENIEKIKNKIENDIENGYISIEGYKILFSERTIKDKIKIKLPTEYEQMEDMYIQIKYPAYKNKDKIILTNDRTTINFMFDFNERYIEPSHLEEVREQMFGVLKKLHPSLVLIEKDTINLPLFDVTYFEIVTPAMDKDIYNFMYFFIVDSNLVIGSFNCYDDDKKEWQPIIRQVIESLEIIEDGELE